MKHYPHKWVMLKITHQDGRVIFKILGSWYGGFAYGDSWCLNSGVKDCEVIEDFIYFHGHSGSIYVCHKDCYGVNMAGSSILNSLLNSTDAKVEIMPENTAYVYIDYATGETLEDIEDKIPSVMAISPELYEEYTKSFKNDLTSEN